MSENIVAMAKAAMRDERLSDGALYGKLAAEIERLRAVLASSEMQLASNYRSRAIEECARVAESYGWDNQHGTKIIPSTSANIAAAIRALKEKP